MITIDTVEYDIPVLSLRMKAEFLDKYAERTQDGVLHRELIGVYFNYELQFGQAPSMSVFAAVWQKLTEPVEFHTVIVPDDDGDFTFTAYFSNIGADILKNKASTKLWKNLTVNFIAQSPARTP